MCSQNAENVISEPLILKILWVTCPRTLLEVTKYEPPRQNQNSTPMHRR